MDARATAEQAPALPVADQSTTRTLVFLLTPIAIVAILPLLPFVNNYIIAAIVRALIFISLGQAWNVVAGIGGQLSLGHGVFLGIGCYTTGILFNKYGIPPWIGMWGGRADVAGVRAGDGRDDAAHARRVLRAGDGRGLARDGADLAPFRRSDRRRGRSRAEIHRQFAVGDAVAHAGAVPLCRTGVGDHLLRDHALDSDEPVRSGNAGGARRRSRRRRRRRRGVPHQARRASSSAR